MCDQKGVRPPPDHGAEGRVDVPFVAGTQEIKLLTNGTSGRLHRPNIAIGSRAIRIHQHGDARDRRCEFAQQHKPFDFELGLKNTHARHIAAWRLRLVTRPNRTGSSLPVNTIGIVVVTALAANVGRSPPPAMINVTFWSTNSAAIAGNRSYWPSAQRNSIFTF